MDADDTVQQLGDESEVLREKLNDFKKQKFLQNDKIDFELTTGMVQDLINKHQDYYKAINTFNFNLFDFTEVVGRKLQMPFMAIALLQQNNLNHIIDGDKFL